MLYGNAAHIELPLQFQATGLVWHCGQLLNSLLQTWLAGCWLSTRCFHKVKYLECLPSNLMLSTHRFFSNMSIGIHGSVNSQTVNYGRDLGDGFSLSWTEGKSHSQTQHWCVKWQAFVAVLSDYCARDSNIGFNSSQNNQQGNVLTSKSTSHRTDYSQNKELQFHPQLRPKPLWCETNYVSDHFSILFMSMFTDSVCLHF